MSASTERKLIRWLHIIISIPIVGYIYGPVSQIPEAVVAVRFIIFPVLILSGLWLWKGHVVKKWIKLMFEKKSPAISQLTGNPGDRLR